MKFNRAPSKHVVHVLHFDAFQKNALAKYKRMHPTVDMAVEGFNVISTLGTHGVVQTSRGWVGLVSEGVIDANPISIENPLEVPFYAETKTGSSMFPWCTANFRPENIPALLSGKTMLLHEFVRSYNYRLENNYSICENHLNEMNQPVKTKARRKVA